MISTRHVPVTCVLVALALVPTVIHSYGGAPPSDGRTAAAVPAVLAEFQSVPSGRNATWGKRRFDSDDWMERQYNSAAGDEIRLTVVRSLDAKSVYHHPELAISDAISFPGVEVRTFEERPEIPVYVLQPAPGVTAAGMYVLHHSDRFVADPIWFQIRTAGELLFTRRQPMTLFFVLRTATREGENDPAPLKRVLFAAIDAFLRQPSPGA